jgi:hypothetical protein
MSSGFNISDASVSNLAKRKYGPQSRNMYNGLVATLGLLKKTYDNRGERIERGIPTGYNGGACIGGLGTANAAPYERAYFTTKTVMISAEINKRTIAQFKDEGAFVEGIRETMKKTVEKFNWVMNFLVTGNSDGALGTIDSVAVVTAGTTWDLTITAASWVKARWEVREHVNVGTGTERFEITAVTRSTRVVRVVKRSGTYTPLAGDVVYLDGGYGNSPEGLLGVLSATSGTKYGVTIADRWQAYQKDASSATISPDLLNDIILNEHDNTGIVPTHILMPTLQVRKMLNSIEDLKRYGLQATKLAPRAKELVGQVSFSGIEYLSVSGAIPILVERFLPDATTMAVNFNESEISHSDQGWHDDEGFIFLRKAGSLDYEARYGGFLENYFPPTLNAYLYGLSTTA